MPQVIKAGQTVSHLKEVPFRLVSSVDLTPVTGATVTVRRTLDGVKGAGAGTVTEDDSVNEPGLYHYTPTAAEIASTVEVLKLTFSATGALPVSVEVLIAQGDVLAAPETKEEIATATVTEIGTGSTLTALATQASVDSVAAEVTAVKAVTDAIPAAGAINNLSSADVTNAVGSALDAKGLTSANVSVMRIAGLLSAGDWTRVGNTITLSDGTTLALTEADGIVTAIDVTPA